MKLCLSGVTVCRQHCEKGMIYRADNFSFAKPKSIHRLGAPVAALLENSQPPTEQQAHPFRTVPAFPEWQRRLPKLAVR
jgi:hypothetical protein